MTRTEAQKLATARVNLGYRFGGWGPEGRFYLIQCPTCGEKVVTYTGDAEDRPTVFKAVRDQLADHLGGGCGKPTTERCSYTNRGIPSINHPEKPTVPPWQCVLPEGHDPAQMHSRVPVCSGTLRVQNPVVTRDWPCVLAEGHEGDHVPPVESRHVHRPLREMTREELISIATLALSAQEDAEAMRSRHWQHAFMWQHQVETLASYALDNGKSPHGNNHTADCWLKSGKCFAFALIGSGGLERALEYIAGREVRAGIRPSEQTDLFTELEENEQ